MTITKKILKFIAILSVISVISPASLTYASTLDNLTKQKNDLQNSINANKQQINSLQDMISSLDNQTATTQKEIDLTNQIIALTNEQIAQTETQINQKQAELTQKQDELDETVRVFYETGQPSALEIVAGANNLSDAFSQTQYMESLSTRINDQANVISQAKTDLENKKADLQKQEASLESQKSDLANKRRNLANQAAAKNRLLSQTNSELTQLQGEMNDVSAAIYAERLRLGGYSSGGTGGYPWANSAPCTASGACPSDPWGFGIRQCTSYAAWYFNAVEGKSWYNTRPGSGSAWNWPALASDQGYSVSSTPRAGAIASWPRGGIYGSYGHVAIVRSVNANGTINVSEYNWIQYSYSERNNISPGGARFIY
jgi:surface antigen/peptidoglycan hydrolase CwlO-like protein